YAARRSGNQAIVLLRSSSLDWTPFTIAFVVAAAAGALLAAVAAFLLAGAVAQPVRRVAVASRQLAARERPDPLPVTGSDEVKALATAFNQMAEELDRSRDAERAFLLSVSHELKTPLSAIRGHGEALLDGVIEPAKVGAVVVAESERLERLVRDLLDLARLDQRVFTVSPRAVGPGGGGGGGAGGPGGGGRPRGGVAGPGRHGARAGARRSRPRAAGAGEPDRERASLDAGGRQRHRRRGARRGARRRHRPGD